ncbi:nucleotide exchange factor GrpE, partial [Roseomonas chloroacetimidivorans]|uniref:nucleotide exchange factor GrpE n=1 Tax=Roseomonas chloroacetimidivorans TaxID=1766656 RepID=UPI003C767E62
PGEAQAAVTTPDRVAELEAERDALKDRWLRAEAELANLRARATREVEDARQYAIQKFARDVVEAAEDLHRGLASLPTPAPEEPEIVSRLREGLSGIERSFLATLERNGVTRRDPTGKAFDPNFHEAVADQPTTDHPPGSVAQAWSSVWLLNGRLLRPALVVVARAPAQQEGHAAAPSQADDGPPP